MQQICTDSYTLNSICDARIYIMTQCNVHLARLLVILVSILTVSGSAEGKIDVFVSILPQKYFMQQIGKDFVDVQVMVQPGASPATYEPKPRQMADIAKTQLYFSIGVPFENVWLSKIAASNPKLTIVATDQGIQKSVMADHFHQETHADHHTANRNINSQQESDKFQTNHGTPDPHIWLSPSLVRIQARTILKSLQKIDPVHSSDYQSNYKAFMGEVSKLDAELKMIFSGNHGLRFIVFHPSWGYFADTYGLKQVPIEIEGKRPKPAQLKLLIDYANQNDIKVIFVQPQFSAKSAQVIARGIGGQVVIADPLAENWADNLRNVALKIRAALR